VTKIRKRSWWGACAASSLRRWRLAAASIDRVNVFPADLYRRMGQEGLLGLARPQGAGKTTPEWAATLRDAGLRHTKESAMAKLRASDVAMKVTVEALQIHGASGYSRSLPLERYVRDAKLTQIYEGTKPDTAPSPRQATARMTGPTVQRSDS
jgi:alkylation response protein AidB-like acyl-CoA dehydrogenase